MPSFVYYISLSIFFHLVSPSRKIKAVKPLKSQLVQHESFAFVSHPNEIIISFPGPLFSPFRFLAFKCICYTVNKNNCFTTVFEETFPKRLYKRIDL